MSRAGKEDGEERVQTFSEEKLLLFSSCLPNLLLIYSA